MTDAKRAILDQTPDNTLIVADMQEMPRGRFGRPFFATPGKGIYMSMVLQPNQNFEEIAQYTVIMAVAVARAMDALAGVHTEMGQRPLFKRQKSLRDFVGSHEQCGNRADF